MIHNQSNPYITLINLCLLQIEVLKEKDGYEKQIEYRTNIAKFYLDEFVAVN